MQGWDFPQEVGEPERWEPTRISGSGLPVSNGWQSVADSFASDLEAESVGENAFSDWP